MKRILCFGDSNTWGYCPELPPVPRYPESVRWTSLLQKKLGSDFTVVEFGLCGCEASGKDVSMGFIADARKLFPPVLFASLPVDVIVIMLGTNDLKKVNDWNAGDSAKGIQAMVQSARGMRVNAPVVVCAPVILDERVLKDPEFPDSAMEDSKQCAKDIEELCKSENLIFFDTNKVVLKTGNDGCHFTEENHASFADGLFQCLKEQQLV